MTNQEEKLILEAMAEVAELKGKYEALKTENEYLKRLIDKLLNTKKPEEK